PARRGPRRDPADRRRPCARAAAADTVGPRGKPVRAFLAVPADPAWVAAAEPLAGRLRRDLPRASWARRGAWDLTLKFLGEISQEDAERSAAAMAPLAAASRAGALPPGGALLLPPRGRPRVLAVGFGSSERGAALSELARSADAAAARIVEPQGSLRR